MITRLSKSVRARTVLFGTLVIVAFLFIAGFTFDKAARQGRTRELERDAGAELESICLLAAKTPIPHPLPTARDSILLVQLIASNGLVVSSSANVMDMEKPFVSTAQFPTKSAASSPWRTTIDGKQYLLVGRKVSGDAAADSVYVAAPLSDVDRLSRSLRQQFAWWSPVLFAATALGLWLVVGQALKPVDRMRREVDAIEAADLSARVAEPGSSDELGKLASTMNQMLGRLQTSSERQTQFVSDASHELRTPLAVMRTRLEVGLRNPLTADWPNAAKSLLDQNIRMEKLVANLLSLAKGHSLAVVTVAVDLDECVRLQVSDQRALSNRVAFDLSKLSAGRVQGDPEQLSRLAQNLISNAATHARSKVQVALSTGEEGWVELSIEDDGPGIAPDERERVFGRFTRLDSSRAVGSGGSGLGLAIAQEIAERHGGTISFSDPATLGGARAVVRLPAGQ
jgi:signal transduction histidine kinase